MNRSAPHAPVTLVLTVSDIRTAVACYGEVFGFVEYVRIGQEHRSQIGLPDQPAAEVAEVRPGRRVAIADGSRQVMLKVADASAVLEDALGLDLNQTLVKVAPEEWGGQSVTPRPRRAGDGRPHYCPVCLRGDTNKSPISRLPTAKEGKLETGGVCATWHPTVAPRPGDVRPDGLAEWTYEFFVHNPAGGSRSGLLCCRCAPIL